MSRGTEWRDSQRRPFSSRPVTGALRWCAAALGVPLAHTWLLPDASLETAWLPLHFAWIVGAGIFLGLLLQHRTPIWIGVLWTAMSFGVTALVAWVLATQTLASAPPGTQPPPQFAGWLVPPTGRAAGVLLAEFAVLLGLFAVWPAVANRISGENLNVEDALRPR